MTEERSPLYWPAGRPRSKTRLASRFSSALTVAKALRGLSDELARLGARNEVVSTNLDVRLDGLPRSGQRAPDDPGVAVYFSLNGERRCLACDRFLTVHDNLRAITLHVQALRGIERWGVGTIDQAFEGYRLLEAPRGDGRTVREQALRILELEGVPAAKLDEKAIRFAWRERVIERGQDADVRDLTAARDELLGGLTS